MILRLSLLLFVLSLLVGCGGVESPSDLDNKKGPQTGVEKDSNEEEGSEDKTEDADTDDSKTDDVNTEDTNTDNVKTTADDFSEEYKMIKTATIYNQADDVREILKNLTEEERKALVNIQDEHGYTPLHNASLNNNVEIVKILLEAGAQGNTRSYKSTGKKRPLDLALDQKELGADNKELVEILESRTRGVVAEFFYSLMNDDDDNDKNEDEDIDKRETEK